ncbi:AAA family ATPase [candidate division KSB1 bacterium]|nr:AAA family ATPase [candidate division KSB1 bacterium]
MPHIGLTGTNASGKTSVVKYLRSKGFKCFSLSDIIREELVRRNLQENRENLFRIGNDLREQSGPAVLAQKTIEKLTDQYSVIDSIRNVFEISALKTVPDFYLVAVDAPVEIRFARAQKRGRNENAPTLQDFINLENAEKSADKTRQNLDQCMDLADYQLFNDGNYEQLLAKIDAILADIDAKIKD